jgi:CDP-glucose 4,6-dehydratase
MWKLNDSIRYDEGWNFGPKFDDTKSVEWILNYLYYLYKIPPNWTVDESKNPKEAINLSLDSSKAYSILGWKTQWNIETTLKKIIDWNSDFNENIQVEKICLKQILQYTGENY